MFADESRLVRVIDVAAVTIGVGFVETNATYGCAFVELCLPTTDFVSTGISTFEDWLRILRATKDDLNQEAILRLHFHRRSAAGLRHSGVQIRQTSRDDRRRTTGTPPRDPMDA